MSARTLADRVHALDHDRFHGRAAELVVLTNMLDPAVGERVAFVHGPGGIGKSALLRALARVAAGRGFQPFWLECRTIDPIPGEIALRLDGIEAHARPLLLVDTFERRPGLGTELREVILPSLPADAVVVIAGRRPPDSAWLEGGWEGAMTEIALGGLPEAEARELVSHLGVRDAAAADRLVAWGAGSPLALTLAGRSGALPLRPAAGDAPLSPDGVRRLVRRLLDEELTPAQRDVVDVASIARITTAPLLQTTLRSSAAAARDSHAWLGSQTFAEPLDAGLALHDLVRRAVRAELRERAPERERELRRRVADHLHAVAIAGEPRLTVDLADLIVDDTLRGSYSWRDPNLHIDEPRDGDADRIETLLGSRAEGPWWDYLRRYLTETPERVVVARDNEVGLCGLVVALAPPTSPAWAAEDPWVAGPLAHAAEHVPDGHAVVFRDSIDLSMRAGRASPGGVRSTLNPAAMIHCGLPNPRCAYLPTHPDDHSAIAFLERLGARREPSLDRDRHGRPMLQWILDYGPGGLFGLQRDIVYRELGLAPRPPSASVPVDEDSVREALRAFHEPLVLATSPLASGSSPAERAASVRTLLVEALDRAFAPTPQDAELRRALEAGYLEPGATHDRAVLELHLSRSTYFRRLRRATERLASAIDTG